jgi:hypothetical protein
MYVSSRFELTLKIKKGCKDDQDFLDLQPCLHFYENKPIFYQFNVHLILSEPSVPGLHQGAAQIE